MFGRPGIKATVCKNENFLLLPVSAGGCLASCLTFRPFLTLDPWQHGC